MTNATDTGDRRALLQGALQALDEMQAKLDSVEQAGREPIAIVGLGCRFPGGANTPEEYWQLLREGRDAVSTFPEDRRVLAAAAGIDLQALGDAGNWYGGFLEDLDQFDPNMFGISPREAVTMDPQQRLVLEVSWEALERAGIAPDSLAGSTTGVFVGITSNDYVQLAKLGGPAELDVYAATGGALNAAAGRVAYTLGLQGPAMAIDTACSSSLVAVHQACLSLRAGDCDMAIAGGVNVVLMPEAFICFTRWGMMAPDGRCKTFDADADGFVRSEGCGMVVLKRLSDAIAAGDPVAAVIRGSAVNQDGRSSGLTVPNGPAQQAVLRKALGSAGVAPADVQYVEAHGTGTTLGDPIEVEAIGAVLGQGRGADQPLVLGSVKTNLGHLESAAGIAGLIKVVLAMEHGEVPAHLHFHERSPKIPWPDFPVIIPTEATPWPSDRGRRVAGVSGFGFSGTNAHVVLESAPPRDDTSQTAPGPSVVALSARSESALRVLAGRLGERLEGEPGLSLADVCYTAGVGRAQFAHRLAVVADSTADAAHRLAAIAAGDAEEPLGRAGRPRVAWLFTGQGSQYPGMAAGLYRSQRVFREAFDRCAAVVDPLLGCRLAEVVFSGADDGDGDGHVLHQTRFTQPALFAVEYGLAELWQSWGVRPQAVVGHSLGEYVAAVVAGVWSVEDGLRLVVARAGLMQELPAGGAMTAIFAPVAEVAAAVAGVADRVSVAAVNGAAHTVISGVGEVVGEVAASFAGAGVRVQPLKVSHAFHSPLIEPMLAEFAEVLSTVQFNVPRVRLISNLTGRPAGAEITKPDYWLDHIRNTVQFDAGLRSLVADGIDTFVEIGPHPVLSAMGQAGLPDVRWVPTMRRGRDDLTELLQSVATLYVAGATIAWDAIHGPGHQRVALPTYPFERQRYWIDPPRHRDRREIGGHPLLGRRTKSPLVRATIYENLLDAEDPSWLADHRLFGTVILPGSAYLEMVLAAASEAGPCTVEMLAMREALRVPPSADVLTQVVLKDDGDRQTVEIISQAPTMGEAEPPWTTHVTATVHPDLDATAPPSIDPQLVAATFPLDVDVSDYYARLHDAGVEYGPTFRGLTQLRRGDGAAFGLVELPADVSDSSRYHLHPALLDSCFHVVGAVIEGSPADTGDPFVPVTVDGMRLFQSGSAAVWCAAEVTSELDSSAAGLTVRVTLYDTEGKPVASIERLGLRRAPRSAWQRDAGTGAGLAYTVAWRPQPLDAPARPGGSWLILADRSGVGDELALQLTAEGASCTVVSARPDANPDGPSRRQVDTGDRQAFDKLLSDCLADGPLRGVISLWALDAPADPQTTDEVEAGQAASLRGTLHIAQALAEHDAGDARLWMVTRGAQPVDGDACAPLQAAAWGMGRAIAAELPRLRCSLVDLDPAGGIEPVSELAVEVQVDDSDDQIAHRGGRRLVARLSRHVETKALGDGQPYELVITERGVLDNLSFVPTTRREPGPGEIEVEVRATGLNFRDVLNVLGMYPGDPGPPGLECAGIVTALGDGVTDVAVGDAVVGIAAHAYDAYVVTKAELVVRMPATLTFAEAATIPIAYLTANYGLLRLAGLQPGERVLIHAAAGGVGMAAVSIAQRVGAEVFATVGSPEKRRHLEALGVRHIYSSRTLDFADQIITDTDGAGVDVVLNSLADEFIDKSFAVLADSGRFLEIGKRGIWSAEQVAESHPGASYHPYDLADLFARGSGAIQAMLQSTVDEIAAEAARPLPLRAFPAEAIGDAFRFMAQARHIGKVVVTHPVASRGAVRPDGWYLITGGLGGLGLAVAGWLVERGARRVALVGRRPPGADALTAIEQLKHGGAELQVIQADVSDAADVERVLSAINTATAPLRGVVHAAGVLDDGALAHQSWDRFVPVLAPKATAGWLLDRLTRTLPLDFFALFSSASALLGSPGQANYAAANAFLDGLAHQRRAAGLPALAVGWGAWTDVGMAAALDERDRRRITERGIGTITPEVGVAAFGAALTDGVTQVAIVPIDWPVLRANWPGTVPPLLSELADEATSPRATAASAAEEAFGDALAKAAPERRHEILVTLLQAQVAKVLGLDATSTIDSQQGFTELGMDSLMAVELSNRLAVLTDLALPSTLAFEQPTLDDLAAHLQILLADRIDFGDTQHPTSIDEELAGLSADELTDELLKELDDAGY
jgi:acyl transferase domain-containing protein/acyl carrier protein